MWQTLGELLVSRTLVGVAVQAALMLVVTLITMYGILRSRRDTVVVLSHSQIMVSTLISTVICEGVYQGLLWLGPAGRWSKGWVIGIVVVTTVVARMLTMAVLSGTDGGKSIRDTSADERSFFNCNWPLISRCANQSLFYLCGVYLVMHKVWQ